MQFFLQKGRFIANNGTKRKPKRGLLEKCKENKGKRRSANRRLLTFCQQKRRIRYLFTKQKPRFLPFFSKTPPPAANKAPKRILNYQLLTTKRISEQQKKRPICAVATLQNKHIKKEKHIYKRRKTCICLPKNTT